MTAKANPVLKRLGLDDSDRVVIMHADDIGMCHATITAFAKAIDFGIVTSGSIMVPCPWFLEMAAWCRANPDADVGVHATVTSEWKTYRWGPMTTRDPASGLIDDEGYFPHRRTGVDSPVDLEAVELEVRTQIDRAVEAGIHLTHVDQHMFALGYPTLLPAYLKPVLERGLPPILFRNEEIYRRWTGVQDAADEAVRQVAELVERGVPAFDSIYEMPRLEPEGQVEITKQVIDDLEPGLHLILMHPVDDTPEVRAIIPDSWQGRVANLEAMLSEELAAHIKNRGVHLIGYRPLHELMAQVTID